MFDFSQFWNVGEELVKFDDEAFIRSAIGRYYYALFSSVRQYLVETKNQKDFLSRRNIHHRIIKKLLNSNDDTEYYIGSVLDSLRDLRNDADYSWICIAQGYFDDKLEFARNESRKALDSLNALKNSPPFEID